MQKNIIKISEALGNRYDFLSHNTKKYHYPHQLIKNLCDISGGKRLPAGDYYTDTPTDFKYLQVTDLSADTIDFNNLKNIQEETFNKLKKYALRKHDIIISIAGTIGKIYYVEDDIKNVILTENCAKIRIKDNIELLPKCFSYIMELPFAQDIINSSYIKTTIPKLGIDKIKAIKFPYPIDTKTQKQIISIMDSAYRQKIEMEKQAQELLDSIDNFVLQELRITLPEKPKEKSFKTKISLLLGGKYNPEYNQPYFQTLQQAINNIDNAKSYKISDLISSDTVNTSNFDFINYIDLGCIEGLTNTIEYKRIEQKDIPSRAKMMIEQGDFIFSGLAGSISSIAIVDKSLENMIASTGFFVIKPSDLVSNQYLFSLFKTKFIQNLLIKHTSGAIMPAIATSELQNIKIPIPDKKTQTRIADTVQNMIERAKDLRIKAKQNLENAKQKVEKILLGE